MRLQYIDFLKGLAIFFMVMGHFLSWTFEGGIPPGNEAIRLVRDFIYAFHMPLFMFMSGYVINLKGTSFSSGKSIVKLEMKRSTTLLVPSITSLIMGYCLRNGWIELPWFLIALFLIVTVFCSIQYVGIVFKLSSKGLFFLMLCGYVLLFGTNRITLGTEANLFLHLTETQIMYPYFVLGYYFQKHELYHYIDKYQVYTIAIVGFITLFYVYYFCEQSPSVHAIIRYGLAICGIVVIYILSRSIGRNSKVYKILAFCGVNSLQIYLLSYYFIPIFPPIGNMISTSYSFDMQTLRSTIFLQLFFGIAISVYCITMCIICTKIIEKSRLLNFLFFGKK